jgi:large subunit ribosomal protein L10
VYLRVLKNTLARRAIAGTPYEKLAESLTGPLIYGISSDPVTAAKVLNDFAKGNDKLVVRPAPCRQRPGRGRREGARLAAEPRRAAGDADGAPCRRRSPPFVRTLNEVPARFAAPWPRCATRSRQREAAS